jgi:hypothetical protein
MTYTLKCRLGWLLNRSQTSVVRLWFSLASLGFASFFFFTPAPALLETDLYYALKIMPCWAYFWGFLIHGLTLMYGVLSRRFSTILYWFEAVFGSVLWGLCSISTIIHNGYPDAILSGALIAWWIQYRYPSYSEKTDEL